MPAVVATASTPQTPESRERRNAFLTLAVAFVMEIVDGTIVNVAVPAIRADLGASAQAMQWSVAGYSLAFAVLLISGGRAGDIFGYRRLFMIGMTGFTLASLLCGIAATPEQLVLARLAQGAAAALMAPQVMALIQLLYPPAERVHVLARFGLLGGISAVFGSVLGGVLIRANIGGLDWRPIFLINVPVGLAGLAAAKRFLPDARSQLTPRLDVPGNLLAIATVFAFVFPLAEGRAMGWPIWCVTILLSAPILCVFLVRHLRRRSMRQQAVLIDPILFQDAGFAIGVLISLLFWTAAGGFLFVLTLALQIGRGLDPLQTGLIHMPFAIGVGFGVALLGRKVLPHLGRNVLVLGAAVMALAIATLAFTITIGAALFSVGAALLFAGLGMGVVSGPLSPIALARVDPAHAGAASGALKSVQQLGTALGAGVLGGLYFAWAGDAYDASLARLAMVPAVAAMIALLIGVIVLSRRLPQKLFD